MEYRVWRIDGNDLIVASSNSEMKRHFFKFWGHHADGHTVREMTSGQVDQMIQRRAAHKFLLTNVGYYPDAGR